MSEQAGDWRIAAGVTRFPEDNNVVGIAINAECRPATDSEKSDLAFADIYLGELALDEIGMRGKPVVVRYSSSARQVIACVPWLLPDDPCR